MHADAGLTQVSTVHMYVKDVSWYRMAQRACVYLGMPQALTKESMRQTGDQRQVALMSQLGRYLPTYIPRPRYVPGPKIGMIGKRVQVAARVPGLVFLWISTPHDCFLGNVRR